MKTINLKIEFYFFSELEKEAQQKAINNHFNFLHSQGIEQEDEHGKMIIEEYNPSEEEVIEDITANELIFYKNGDLAHTVTYTGNQEKSEQTYFIDENKKEHFICEVLTGAKQILTDKM